MGKPLMRNGALILLILAISVKAALAFDLDENPRGRCLSHAGQSLAELRQLIHSYEVGGEALLEKRWGKALDDRKRAAGLIDRATVLTLALTSAYCSNDDNARDLALKSSDMISTLSRDNIYIAEILVNGTLNSNAKQ